MIDYKTGLKTFTDFLNNNENFTFTKLGDGELLCMMNPVGENCDMHPYTPELADKLYYFVESIAKHNNLYVAKWEEKSYITDYRDKLLENLGIIPNDVEYNCILPQTYNLDNEYLYNFYKAIKENKKRKIYLCPDRLNDAKNFLNIDVIINIPLLNSFSVYDVLVEQLKKYIKDGDIILYSCGMMSKSLICELLDTNPNITNIDLGSGMDSIILNGNSRLGQPTPDQSKKYFNNLLNTTYNTTTLNANQFVGKIEGFDIEYINRLKTSDLTTLEYEIQYNIGSSSPEYFKCNKANGLELQQIPQEYSKLLEFFKTLKISKYLELGVGNGGSFLLNCFFIESDKYVAVDNISYFHDKQLKSINKKIDFLIKNNKNVIFNNMNTDYFFENNIEKFDVIFIDADHSYDGVLKDYENSLKCMDSGYIILHDINSLYCDGVVRLWNEIKDENSLEFIASDVCGIGIKKIIK